MEQGNNKNGLIIVLAAISVILLALVVLLATGVVSFNDNETAVDCIKEAKEVTPFSVRTYRFFGYTTDSSPDMYTMLKLYSNNKYDIYINNCEGVDKYSGTYTETDDNFTLTGEKSIVFTKKYDGNTLEFNFQELGACHNSGGTFSLESNVVGE